MTFRLLAIYLQDHLAGATAGIQLAHRARSSNEGTPLGDFLAGLAKEIDEDREALEEIMLELDVGTDRIKVLVAWGAEKAGRLKLNGRLLGYSPLSRLLELEGLAMGITGKLAAWQALRAALGKKVAGRDIDGLVRRAEKQLAELAEHREQAARTAFAEETASAP